MTRAVELATLTVDEETGLPFARIFKPHEIDAGAAFLPPFASGGGTLLGDPTDSDSVPQQLSSVKAWPRSRKAKSPRQSLELGVVAAYRSAGPRRESRAYVAGRRASALLRPKIVSLYNSRDVCPIGIHTLRRTITRFRWSAPGRHATQASFLICRGCKQLPSGRRREKILYTGWSGGSARLAWSDTSR